VDIGNNQNIKEARTMKRKGHVSFIAGFLAGAVVFGGSAAFAASGVIANLTTSRILVNGADVQFEAYNINGSNYFKLRDMAAAVDFSVVWDGEGNRVLIDTSRSYDPNEQYAPPTTAPTPIPTPTSPPDRTGVPEGILNKDLAIWLDENYQPYENEYEAIRLINEERVNAGLEPVTLNLDLCKIARIKAVEMVELDYLSHTSPNYGSPKTMIKAFGLNPDWVAENASYTGGTYAEGVTWNWMHSKGHRANILNPAFTTVGVGVCPDGTGLGYWSLLMTD
jgi:uncharacterized protein YkwD